jgi:predicted glycoside hydrolase/deacetylase ChbG (UPF0249 family)
VIKTKNIVLCADDFGLTPGISDGILKLVRNQRLSAVSCMVNSPYFNLYSKQLSALKSRVQIGMHFNLTEGYLLSKPTQHCFTLNELLLKAHVRWVNIKLIIKEFNTQLDEFIKIMGTVPDFIDGHQHVHQFPQIRDIVLESYQLRLKPQQTYIRSTFPIVTLPQYQFKAMVLAQTGGRTLQAKLKQLNIPHNGHFSGIYDFAKGTHYRSLFNQWLSLAPAETLIMCHPGEGPEATDSIGHARSEELNYLLSEDFLSDCNKHHINLRLTTSPKS